MTVVSKWFVKKVTPTAPGTSTAQQVELGAVCRGVENAMWSQYTPVGNITMGILNEDATAQFEEGAEYIVTFTRVAKPEAHDGHRVMEITTKSGARICETCGQYPTYENPHDWQTGTPNWSAHDALFGPETTTP